MKPKRLIGGFAVASGSSLTAISLFADKLGIGDPRWFGTSQIIGLMIGLIMLVVGFVLMRRRENESPDPTLTFASISRIYQTVALITFNSALLTVVTIMTLHFLIPTESFFWRISRFEAEPISATLQDDHYYRLDQPAVTQLQADFDAFARSGEWCVAPWVGMTSRTFTSNYLNIDEAGIRATTPPDASHADQPLLVIWAFGGSTLFGWGLSDDYTVPSLLQSELQTHFPDQQVQVINFGTPWYNSSFEFTQFTANLRDADQPPDIVLFLDGLNDIDHALRFQNQAPLFNKLDSAWEAQLAFTFAPFPWLALSPNFPVFRAAQVMGIRPAADLQPEYESRHPDLSQQEHIDAALTTYQTNRHMALALSREYDIEPYFVIQPIPAWLDDARQTITYDDYRIFVESIMSEDPADTYDLTAALSVVGPQYELSVDGFHYSDVAAEALAAHIADLIMESYPTQ